VEGGRTGRCNRWEVRRLPTDPPPRWDIAEPGRGDVTLRSVSIRSQARAGALLALVVAAAATAAAAGSAAAQGGERIERYEVAATVTDEGHVDVVETITYDFGGAERHGIERFVPVRERWDGTYDRIVVLEDIDVRAGPGTPAQWEREPDGALERIRIGDPDRTITGTHTYELSYRLRGALNGFEDHVELYWDAVGHEWSAPVAEATVRVDTPAEPERVLCLAGPERSTLPCDTSEADAGGASFAATHLAPGEGVTVVVAMPTGAVPEPSPILDERWDPATAFAVTPATASAAGALLVGGLGGAGLLVWRNGRDRRWVGSPVDVVFGNDDGAAERVPLRERTETPVEYVPPDGIRPGQVGTLVDEVAHPLDVTATIVDLAVRGWLRIEEVDAEGGRPTDWRLERLRSGDGLLAYERLLFDGLFDDDHPDEVRVGQLEHRFAERLGRVQDALYDDVSSQGWFHTRPDRERGRWLAIGLVVAALGVVLTVAAAAWTRFGLVPLPVVAVGVVLAALSGRMPHRTPAGTGMLRRVQGFRRFIVESEAERARFAEQAQLFTEYLPYAVVFGVTERWARTFAGLGVALPAPDWYVGSYPGAFDALLLARALDGFAVTTSGTITSVAAATASSGASGFSGGFSGGGIGGGGGGSW
jgi:hypothetical protein